MNNNIDFLVKFYFNERLRPLFEDAINNIHSGKMNDNFESNIKTVCAEASKLFANPNHIVNTDEVVASFIFDSMCEEYISSKKNI